MNNTIFLGLVHNAALLLAIALIYDLTNLRWQMGRNFMRQALMGMVVGATGITLMLTPWVLVPGIIFDTRSILLGIAGLFLGPIPTVFAMLITAGFRIYQGGAADGMGVSVILATGTIGILWRHLRRRTLVDISWRELYLFGLLIHVAMLACAFILPWETARQVLAQITLPVLLIYPVGTTLLGVLMINGMRRDRGADELRESEERLRLAVQAANIGFFDQNILTRREHYSAEWKKQIGFEEHELSDSILEWQSRVHPDDLPGVLSHLDTCILEQRPGYEAEYRMRHKDGSYRWILARGLFSYNSAGDATRLLGCHIDLTRQKQDQSLYRVLSENIQDVVWILDTETLFFRYISPSVERLRGYTPEEILAVPVDHALTPQAKEGLLELIKRRAKAFQSGQPQPGFYYTEEVEQPCKDGSTVWTEVITSYHWNPDNGHVEAHGVARDISARRRMEEALRESEDKFRYIFDHSIVGKSITLPSGEVTVNQAFSDLLGYTREEFHNKKWQDVTHPDDIELTQRVTNQILSGEKESARFEKRYLHKNGAVVWIDLNTSLRRDPQGKPLYFITALVDITERKRSEEALRESEENYRLLFEQAADGIFITDAQGKYVDVNSSGCTLLGYDRDEILKLNLQAVVTAENQKTAPLRLRELQNGHPVYSRRRMYHKDGSLIDVEINARMLADGRLLSMVRDVTARQRAEESVQAAQDELQRLLNEADQSRQALLNLVEEQKRAEKVLKDNQALLSAMGRTGKIGGWQFDVETLKQLWTEEVYHIHEIEMDYDPTVSNGISFYAPESIPIIEQAVQRAIDFGEPFDLELEIITAKGNHRWVHTIGKAQQENGGTKTVYGTLQDISERKQAEDQIRRLNTELEQRVRERTLQLESANKELEAFAYSVSHDLRAPLRAMDGFSAALMSDYPNQIDERGRHYLERIQEASRRMGQLINDLLSLSRVTRSEFNPARVDLSALAREIASELQAQDPHRQVEIEIAPDLMVQGDAHLLRIALENLLNNAYKFTGQRERACIQVGMVEQTGQAGERVYYVRDNGVGFNMEYAGKLFAPFQRLHGMQEFPGTGIGLVTVQRIIHRHGGRIWPDAALNQGATFYFTLEGSLCSKKPSCWSRTIPTTKN